MSLAQEFLCMLGIVIACISGNAAMTRHYCIKILACTSDATIIVVFLGHFVRNSYYFGRLRKCKNS